ncbi:DHHA1 domain-containing protein [Halosegnis sp.]|uniref:DHHA1 domain-containing protein n=1 Tax=Halosegnis sp. TaxID=2864959 RepID=UPI0035D4C2B3
MSATPVPEMADRAATCAERLRAAERVLVVSHIDADGLTSAAIAGTALKRAGIPHEQTFYKQLDETAVAELAATDYETVLFTDFGSGQLPEILAHAEGDGFTPVIVDHHQPAETDVNPPYHLNPLLFGINGARELSGAGAAYVLARALESSGVDNRDLAATAVVGAVGDMQDSGGQLHGANAAIVEEGVAAGALAEGKDLAVYGKQTRPLPKLLEYATDTHVPGISSSYAGAVEFLDGLDVDCQVEGDWKRWVDLTDAERRRVASALVQHAVRRGVPARKIEQLVATTYTLTAEPEGTELRDASEFSTLLNATARYERADVGLAVCLGDRTGALKRARELLRTHRRNLSEGLNWVKRQGVTDAGSIQWFDAGDEIRETIVGIVAGMSMGVDGVDRSKPVVAFAEESGTETKVSARGTAGLVREGLDLSVVMSEASAAVGGNGGGHDIAAGATIPAGKEETFIQHADQLVADQLG